MRKAGASLPSLYHGAGTTIAGRPWGTAQRGMRTPKDSTTPSLICHGNTSVSTTRSSLTQAWKGAFWHVYDFSEVCAKAGVTLKPEKFRFCQREVDFVGYHLDWDTYKPTTERLAAIRDFKMPEKPSITDVRSWFGFVNQLAPFLATAPLMSPFRDLLKKPAGKVVYWDECLQKKFTQAKDIICQLAKQGLAYYDKTRPTIAITDWSKDGIGFVVMQQHCSCPPATASLCCKGGWRLALCGSRHLTPAERPWQ